jgi:hypothetical protein
VTLELGLGLGLELLSLAVVFGAHRVGSFRRPGFYLLIFAFAYHGVTELGQLVTGVPSAQRAVVSADSVGLWTVVVGLSMLAFALVYVAFGRSRTTKDRPDVWTAEELAPLLRALDWRILLGISLILLVLTARGGVPTNVAATSGGFAGQFLVPIVSLAAISFVVSHRSRWIVPTVAVELFAITIAGSRLDVIAAGGVTLFGLMLFGVRPSRRQAVASLLVVLALSVSLDAARTEVGRTAITAASSPIARVQIIAAGAFNSLTSNRTAGTQGSGEPLAARLDGNSFPAAIMNALSAKGLNNIGLTTLLNDVRLAVPSSLDPGKLQTNILDRSEKGYIDNYYNLGIRTDFIPTQLGSMVAYYGPFGLPVLAALLGGLFAFGDRMMAHRTFAGFLVPLWLVQCALTYERGMETYPIAARGVAVILAAMLAIDFFRRSKREAPSRRAAARSRNSLMG